ncbi:MAG TPA: thiamine pyrophosphate-binding protein [Bacteroidales bacterium]|nr:thiamine pyrophosphate-binding protein [Bacteroidales bacterium]
MTVAEYIADRLYNSGVKRVFGIPGGPSIPYMNAFREAGIEFILVSNEASAGIMADVTARLSGTPGICHATFGPGSTNISTGVGGALLDRSPVIVFTSEMPDKWINRTTQMNINHQELFRPLTKATFRVNASNVSEVLESALTVCSAEYPGPVHIGLPSDIADSEIIPGRTEVPSSVKNPPENNIEGIIGLLENSKRPLIAAGLTAARSDAGKNLVSFLQKFRIPVVITPMAKGIIPEDHPCYAGVLFHSLSDYLEELIENADLIIGLGYDPVEFNYESWVTDKPIIHFDVTQSELPDNEPVFGYTGKTEEWFSLLEHLEPGSIISREGIINGIHTEMEAVFEGFKGHFGPVSAMSVLHEELPSDSIITADVGSHLHLLGQFWNTNGKSKVLMTNGWSGMGFGLPAAIAAQMHSPGSTVVCITGDGGFLMMAGEIITARRYNLPVIVVVFSDGELNLIKVKQSWRELPPYGTMLYDGDLFGSDSFLGVRVLNAGTSEAMRVAVIEALSSSGPVIINAVIDPEDYKWLIVRR